MDLITIALMLPFWWGMGLLALALLADISTWWRPRVSRLFEQLERIRRVPPEWTAQASRTAREAQELGASRKLNGSENT